MAAAGKLGSVRRDWRERDVRVVLVALAIAVATVATIALFASQLQRTLVSSASTFLAADRLLDAENGGPVPDQWLEKARADGLRTGQLIEFSTMVVGGDRYQLVSVKAAGDSYPLKGTLEIQRQPDGPRETVSRGPEPGGVWVNPRLLRLLELNVGDALEVGNRKLTITALLVREPDGGFSMAALAPKVLMHRDDVASTGVIQEGSRVAYKYLFAGDDASLAAYEAWLKPQLSPSQEWRSIRDGEALSRSLQRAERFLLLGGSLAVLLAAVAVAVASRQYAVAQRDTVALLKTLGLNGQGITRLYLRRLVMWGLAGTVAGLAIALPLFWALASLLERLLDRPVTTNIDPAALVPALATAVVSLFTFAYPPIRRLRQVPAMRVLRSASGESSRAVWVDIVVAGVAIFGLVWLYAGELALVVSLLGGVVLVLVVLGVLGALLMAVVRRIRGGGTAWRLALVGLYRHRRASLSQMAVFAMTLMLAATLILVRTSLLDDWKGQLPADAPNHFLINIAPEARADVARFWQDRGRPLADLYPMVRGRLTELNGQPIKQAVGDKNIGALNRELNLTWMQSLPNDNGIVQGHWFGPDERTGVSVEAGLAERLGLALGDRLTFTIGAQTLTEPVTSFRTVQWDSMKPNFYVVFPPGGGLEGMPATWITSFYLPAEGKTALNDFTRAFPTVSVLEIDDIIARIQDIIGQVTLAIEAILVMILAAALVVMAAVVSATLQDRQREGALLRTLGGRQSLLVRSTLLEFAVLGGLAGLIGVLSAEAAVYALQFRLFDGAFRWHWAVVVPLPLLAAAVVALFGRWQLRPVLTVSPMLLLRRLE
ncbi:ABC transporter permease [Marinobacter sp. C2H3]|uniref:ABC transporter permease n=1 Tax=Marinobacter sp. C2H3 TaxID=3119003 RepID=UPI00300EE850